MTRTRKEYDIRSGGARWGAHNTPGIANIAPRAIRKSDMDVETFAHADAIHLADGLLERKVTKRGRRREQARVDGSTVILRGR